MDWTPSGHIVVPLAMQVDIHVLAVCMRIRDHQVVDVFGYTFFKQRARALAQISAVIGPAKGSSQARPSDSSVGTDCRSVLAHYGGARKSTASSIEEFSETALRCPSFGGAHAFVVGMSGASHGWVVVDGLWWRGLCPELRATRHGEMHLSAMPCGNGAHMPTRLSCNLRRF